MNLPATQDRSDLFGTSSESVSRLAEINSDIRRTIKRLFEAEQSSSDFLLRLLSPTPIVFATGIWEGKSFRRRRNELLYVIDRSGKIAVFLVAENCLLREALARILNRKSDISVVGATAYSATVVQEMVAVSPQVLLFDPFPKVFSGFPFIAALRRSIAGLRVVMIGMDPDKDLFFRCVRGGIAGYLLRDATANEVLAAVRGVVKSEAVCPPHLCQALFDYMAQERTSFPNFHLKQQLGLTRREQQLVQMISGGFTNKEIAVELGLSEQTVKNHVHRMLRKLGAGDRLAVVEVCRTHGLLPA